MVVDLLERFVCGQRERATDFKFKFVRDKILQIIPGHNDSKGGKTTDKWKLAIAPKVEKNTSLVGIF